jgi:CO/xanthine dehydrogenase Mo-binding subunit
MIDTAIVEVANPSHPYGVRGVGEAPIVAPLAVATNAVSRAINKRLSELPLSPPNVLEVIDGD